MDQPISDPACIGFYFISKSTAQHSRVLVTGDGGDEIFLGYKVFEYQINVEYVWKILNNMPLWMPRGINWLLRKMPDSGYLTKINKVQRFFSALIFPSQQRWAAALSPHSAILPIFNKDYFAEVPIDCSNLEDYFRKLILPQVYLQKVDRMSMSNSLEVRSPYFDTDFIQAMCTLSKKELIKHGKPTKKLISQHFYYGKVKKHGLGTPLITVLGRINKPAWALEPLGISSEFLSELWDKRKKSLAYAQSAWSLYVLNFYIKKWQDMGVLVGERND
jgi:asparagine synthase (glutamine-hydrolysing)